jgi:DNA topoisomerase-1
MKVVVVESPAKAKTINKYLGPGYEVLASFGHIRDLPAKDGSVDPEADFKMIWELDAKGGKHVSEIAKAVRGAEKLILATDPDREGEAISWHVVEALREKRVLKDTPIERVTFNAITKDAVQTAMRNPRQIDAALVDAYLARRALDYLVGFTLSPVLWRKLPGARSAGRVQSVALRLVSSREYEIETFKPREYWAIVAGLATAKGGEFEARLVGADGRRIQRLDVGTADEAETFRRDLEQATFTVANVEAKPAKRHPQPPFTTSTLQQEASRKLGLAPAQTMRIAQRLYEGVEIGGETVGLITYMRTDGVDMAPEAITSARAVIGTQFGDRYVPGAPRRYSVKAKNAQEAHEAVRPTDMSRLPAEVARRLEPEQAKLYELIWLRTIASQMESAEFERTTVDIAADAGGRRIELRATGQVVRFDGFLRAYREDRDDPAPDSERSADAAEDDDENRRLPAMLTGERLERRRIDATQHFTEPPPRYSEASLVKRMEELGIGRPSTYAAILQTLRDREYVRIEKKRLMPEDKGRLVVAFLESFFRRYVEYDFTADLETQLDRVSNNEIDWKQVLRDFWQDFSAAVGETKDLRTTQVLDALNELLGPHIFPAKADGSNPRTCPVCGTGQVSLKLGQVRRVHRLLQLSRVSLHAATRGKRGRRGIRGRAARHAGSRRRSSKRVACHGAGWPVRAVHPARRGGEAEARLHPEGCVTGFARSGDSAQVSQPAPRGGAPPGDRRADQGRHRPLRAPTCSTARPTQASGVTTKFWRLARTARSISWWPRRPVLADAAARAAIPVARSGPTLTLAR